MLLLVRSGGKYGFIDLEAKPVVPFLYSSACDYTEGLAYVAQGDCWEFLDVRGRTAIEFQPDLDCDPTFEEGLCIFSRQGSKGYISRTGRVVIEARYEQAVSFSEGYAFVRSDGVWGVIDHSGALVCTPQFLHNSWFHDGLAVVRTQSQLILIDKNLQPRAVLDHKWAEPFSCGLAAVQGHDRRWGYIDQSGEWAIPQQFRQAGLFAEGLAVAAPREEPLSGFIDATGRFVVAPRYTTAEAFSEGLAAVCVGGQWGEDRLVHGGRWGYINRSGEMVITPQYTRAEPFNGGVALVSFDDVHLQTFHAPINYIRRDGSLLWKDPDWRHSET